MAGSFRSYEILSVQYGQYKTMNKETSVDRDNEPIPWFTYPAIEYLKQLDLSEKSVFEYGSGNSTLFWAKRCKNLVSIEDDQDWYNKIKDKLPEKVTYKLCPEQLSYSCSINEFPETFNVIIIDGNHRHQCALEAIKKLDDDGFIILDNSDWAENISRKLRDSRNLIEVDMTGFGPIGPFTRTTSFFFSRNVKLRALEDKQPAHGIGSVKWSNVWD